ncbi:TetR family transcriptional regulator [Ferrimicrobium acidiphilum]|jgi:AcrR family transcriptional regulator|uniref:TetR family protein n=1 Tax=Ferrimicrobium acidiphilum DSM 19497 TaxID=1121877 RepID=A0A0D8FU48_9ACTN|nr:TetR family transcriptional regulator [Ferrimicrobium acidiphilum]KJE76795.1 TetR family protein [Ferrimicrobium acidiphilum DSM 19497]MCL5052267.1 TetR family transcriptional regulator [Gammaproteobacteria bacterium]
MTIEERKERTRALLAEVAADLFVMKGFDHTTVEEIAQAADISPRTFFRYFATKEEVVMSFLWLKVDKLLASLAVRPSDESLLESVQVVFRSTEADSDVDRDRQLLRLLATTPSLRARWLVDGWESAVRLRPIIAGRLGLEESSSRVGLIANALFMVAETVLDQWSYDGGDFVGDMLAALALLDRGGLLSTGGEGI